MKRTWIALALSLLFVLPAVAQRNRVIVYHRESSAPREQAEEERVSRQHYSRWTDYERESYFGLRLGVSVASVNSDDQYLDGGSGSAGLYIGIVGGIQFTPSAPIFFESGLTYVEKGGKGYYEGSKFTYDLNYLEVPLLIKYKCYLENDMAVQPFLGGFLACGVGGKIKDFGNREAESSFSEANFQRFDGGIRLGCGFSFQNLYIEMDYDFGLANICHDTFDTSHTGCFFATIGVDF